MAASTKRVGKPLQPRRRKPRRGAGAGVAAPPVAPEEMKPLFDEPAKTPQKPNVSVEEAVAEELPAEDDEACGRPEADRTPGSDLH